MFFLTIFTVYQDEETSHDDYVMYSGGLIRVKDLFPDYNSTPSSPKHSKYKLVSKLKSMLKPSDKTAKPTFRSYISSPEAAGARDNSRDTSAIESMPSPNGKTDSQSQDSIEKYLNDWYRKKKAQNNLLQAEQINR